MERTGARCGPGYAWVYRAVVTEAAGSGGNGSSAEGGDICRMLGGQGTRGQRTENMKSMSVTLDVSKLSGWLKA